MKTPAANVTQINNVITTVFKADPYLPFCGTSSLQRFPSTSTSRSQADICLQKMSMSYCRACKEDLLAGKAFPHSFESSPAPVSSQFIFIAVSDTSP